MTGPQIIAKVKALNLLEASFIVFGSCPLALAGIREAQDIDLLVNEQVFKQLEAAGWQYVDKGHNDKPLVKGDYEAHLHWNFTDYKPTLKQLLASATVVEGVSFASLEEVRKWKQSSGRPKDLFDIKLIDAYWYNQMNGSSNKKEKS